MRFRFLLLLCFALPALGQVPCGAPPTKLTLTQPNIFSEQQEQWLGEAMADQLDAFYRPVKIAEQNAYLETIGNRLLAALPPTTLKFHYTLVESSEVNGFSLAGGRVYLTRKLVASAHSEDEIAGVIAHEMGHILTHQFAVETTADLKRLLGITSVGDRADIYAKFQRLLDARMHDKHPGNPEDDDKQDQADRVAVYAAAAAGYRPQAYAEFWDRSFFVGGKTGSRFGDFFNTTKPSQRRLRKIQGIIAELPAGCARQQTAVNPAFQKWQHEVLEDQATVAKVSAEAAGTDVALTPALRLDIDRIRFSRDGKYLLAQDESSIHVLTREPFKEVFRFAAENALPAEFSPDSQQIGFVTTTLHVETWSVATQKLIVAREVVTKEACLQTVLSPDARTLVCISQRDGGADLNFALYDVASGDTVFRKDWWFLPSAYLAYSFMSRQTMANNTSLLTSAFSADGNTLLIGPGSHKLAFDLRTRTPIKLSGSLTDEEFDAVYCFAGDNKVIAISLLSPGSSGIFSFPEGKRQQKLTLMLPYVMATTGSDLVITLGPKGSVMGVADLVTGKYQISSRSAAIDVFGGAYVAENLDGSLSLTQLADIKSANALKTVLSVSPLAHAKSISLSPDGHYLAYSAHTRGTVWDIESGKQVFLVRGFTRSGWTPDGKFLGEFPAVNKELRVMREIPVVAPKIQEMPFKLADHAVFESGHLLEWKLEKKVWTLYATSPLDGSAQWTRSFTDGRLTYTTNLASAGDLIFSYRLDSPLVHDRLRNDPVLKDEAAAVKDKKAGRVIELAATADGTTQQQAVIEVPLTYTSVDDLNRVGDLLYLNTEDNRLIVYSLKTGAQLRQVFGSLVAADVGSGIICTNNRRDEIAVLDKDGGELQHLSLGSPLRFASLRENGSKLILLTADQHIHRFDVPARKP